MLNHFSPLLILFIISTFASPPLVPPRATSFASLNTSILRAQPWPFPLLSAAAFNTSRVSTWVMTSTCCGYGSFTPEAVTESSDRWGLFDEPCFPDSWPIVAEFGYEFMNDQSGSFPICGNLTFAGRGGGTPPPDRATAASWLRDYWECRVANARSSSNVTADSPLIAESGHYPWAGLVSNTASGTTTSQTIPGSEIGENINSINFHIAAARGAARQAHSPFLIDFSSWMNGYITDYSSPGFWGPASSPVGGHSPSLVRRAAFATFMAGAGAHVAEAGAVNYFNSSASTPPPFSLSPLGVVGAEIYSYTHATGDGDAETVRGIPFVPIAMITAADIGWGLGFFYRSLAWDTFALSDSETTLRAYLDALWPRSLSDADIGGPQSEAFYMVAGSDNTDFLMPAGTSLNAALLNSYRVALLVGVGPTAVDEALSLALKAFVEGGGVAVVDAADLTLAISMGWLSAEWLGVRVDGPRENVFATQVIDSQTGWSSFAPVPHAPFCVSATSDSYYIKTGGDPSVTSGWDGGIVDRCCSSSPTACLWFNSAASCAAVLPSAPTSCRSCSAALPKYDDEDVGCPAWAQSKPGVPNGTLPLALVPAELVGAGAPLFTLSLFNGSSVLAATRTPVGEGTVIVMLASGGAVMSASVEGGFGLAAHFLIDRIGHETAPFTVTSNVTNDLSGGGTQLLLNRLPWGWIATLINNNGVIKQPNATAITDPSQGRTVSLALAAREGMIVNAWVANGAGDRIPLNVIGGSTVTVEIEAGGIRLVGVVLSG